jgi:putative flippase GtrA
MSDLQRRPGSGISRSARERRAYRLVLVGGIAGAVAVVTFVLAAIGVLGFGTPFLALVIAVICAVLFRRVVA